MSRSRFQYLQRVVFPCQLYIISWGFRCIANELNAQGTISSEADRLKVLAEERLKSVHGCDRLWSCIEDITEVFMIEIIEMYSIA